MFVSPPLLAPLPPPPARSNRVSERRFALCDVDGTNSLDFREFCFCIWQVCTLDDRGLMSLLFDL
jgi:hypothetical protein